MKNVLRYIFIIIAIGVISSCVKNELLEPVENASKCYEVEFVARNTNYTKSNVVTKSDSNVENGIYSAFFLVYDTNGRLIQYTNLTDAIADNTVPSQTMTTEKGLTNVTVCYVANLTKSFVEANMKATAEEKAAGISDLQKFQQTRIQFAGTGDYVIKKVADSGVVGLPSIDIDEKNGTPSVDCIPMLGVWNGDLTGSGTQKIIEIQVKRLFSKVTFTIDVNFTDGSAEVPGIPKPSFAISSVVVKNIPKIVALFPQTTELTWVDDNGSPQELVYGKASSFLQKNYNELTNSTLTIEHGESHTFSFYTPEYIVQPSLSNFESFEWYKDRDQRYKPELIGNKKATYVEFGGILSTQGRDMKLDYTIYLGENNFDNFTQKRNYNYNHIVSINGISEGGFGYDHRVEVIYTGFLVGFQRATLLDSHFEVRPLRVKFDDDFIKNNKKDQGTLKVEILEPESSDWLRLERPTTKGGDLYCANSTKRKFFTTDLVTSTLSSSSEISYNPFDTANGDLEGNVPVWVYIDENKDRIADQVTESDPLPYRRATIRVTYTPNVITDDNQIVSQDFIVQQRAIYPIETVGRTDDVSRTYGIEYFEEYLYNYDTQDNYGAEGGEYFTSENGIPWGFDGEQISNNDRALYFTGDAGIININELANYFTEDLDLFYDFYLKRDKDGDEDDITPHDYSGYDFNLKILLGENIYSVNSDLSKNAQSAIEYCYNKNKRTANGEIISTSERTVPESRDTVVHAYYKIQKSSFWGITTYTYYDVSYAYSYKVNRKFMDINNENCKWFVPAIDELEDIVINSKDHDFFKEVFIDNLYWSSQPAYHRNYFQYIWGSLSQYTHGVYFLDNLNAARATRYDPVTDDFVSSDISSNDSRLGYHEATTLYGYVTVDNTKEYPNDEDGNYVYKLIGSWNGTSVTWTHDENPVAVTSYKMLDGNTDIPLPEGIQNRTSEHRVRCIYNESPENHDPTVPAKKFSPFSPKYDP